jgi:hypothetical protein
MRPDSGLGHLNSWLRDLFSTGPTEVYTSRRGTGIVIIQKALEPRRDETWPRQLSRKQQPRSRK